MHFVVARLVHEVKPPIQIENKTAADVQRSLINDCVFFAKPGVEKTRSVSEGKVRCHARDAVDHAQPRRNHGRRERNAGKSWTARRDEIEGEEGKSNESDADDREHWTQ